MQNIAHYKGAWCLYLFIFSEKEQKRAQMVKQSVSQKNSQPSA